MPVINQPDMDKAIEAWAAHLMERQGKGSGQLAIVGLISHGDVLARRLVRKLEEAGRHALYGAIDITLYRDDLDLRGKRPALRSSYLPFSTDDMELILVDDVIHTGRTIRAAMEAIFEYGRPAKVELQCLVDRGGREVPIQPDYVAWKLSETAGDDVSVYLRELDGKEYISY